MRSAWFPVNLLLFFSEMLYGFQFFRKVVANQAQRSVFRLPVDLAVLCWLEDVITGVFQVHFFGLNLVFCGGFDLSNSDVKGLTRVFLGSNV